MRSGKQNAAVEMRWAELLDDNMPQELHKNIEEQKAACSEIIASKVSTGGQMDICRFSSCPRVLTALMYLASMVNRVPIYYL